MDDGYDAHVDELQLWLAMLVAQIGTDTGAGFRLSITTEHAALMRQQLAGLVGMVIITAPDVDHFVIDVL